MSTSLSELFESLDSKWKEIDLLLNAAQDCEESNRDLHNALCRSVTVLMTAHLEGFIKDLAKAVIRDLADNSSFNDLPDVIKRTYCQKYLGLREEAESKPAYEKKLEKLIEKFCTVDCTITEEPFMYSSNKNPKPDVLRGIFKNFGIKNVFSCLHESALDQAFSDTSSEIETKIDQLKLDLKDNIYHYPYNCNIERLGLNKNNVSDGKRTLWQEFLDQTNLERHKVAHGNNFTNNESIEGLKAKKIKIAYLQLGLIELLASGFSRDYQEEVSAV